MHLIIEPEVYDRFHKLKLLHKSFITDSDFLSLIVTHFQKCEFGPEKSFHQSIRPISGHPNSSNDHMLRSCPECKFSARTSEELWSHFESIHRGEGSFSCTCGDSYSLLPLFLRHYVDCPVAATDLQDPYREGGSHKRSRAFFITGKSHHGRGTCHSDIYSTFRQHSVHPVPGPSADKPYGCPKCFKGFKNKSLLDQHMHLHYPPRYKCRWCGNVYRWPPVYYHHKQRCKKRPILNGLDNKERRFITPGETYPKFEDQQTPNQKIAVAQQAFAQFMNIQNLPNSHDLNSESYIAKLNGDAHTLPLTCLCTENFHTVSSYLEHVSHCPKRVSTSTYESTVPSLSYGPRGPEATIVEEIDASVLEDTLNMKDITILHSPGAQGMYSCSICCKEFNSKLSLRQHVDGKHRAEGKYLCPTCGKRYRWGASFYYHKKTCMLSAQSRCVRMQAPELLTTHT